MDEAALRTIEARSLVNEKLVKALITLLAVRDPHLLNEMQTLFALAREMHSEVGEGPARVWAKVDEQIAVITRLAQADEQMEIASTH